MIKRLSALLMIVASLSSASTNNAIKAYQPFPTQGLAPNYKQIRIQSMRTLLLRFTLMVNFINFIAPLAKIQIIFLILFVL